jgi:Uma2 family endonuclease
MTLVSRTAERPATYEDLLKVPDNLIAELIDGELFTSPRPPSRYMRAASRLYRQVGNAFDADEVGATNWWITFADQINLEPDVFVPDVAGWRRERVPDWPRDEYWNVAPDWVCEVVSPSTGRLDRVRKLPGYAFHGIPYAWMLDPLLQTLEVYRLEQGRWVTIATHGGDDVVRAEPFEAAEIRLASLW